MILKTEFVEGMSNLASGDYNKLSKFIFDLYDFDNDGIITREDVRRIFCYLPIRDKKISFEETQVEIHNIINKSFEKSVALDYEDFIYLVENITSEIFIYVKLILINFFLDITFSPRENTF
jgi:Ca2+-binding EF-hand superfamily protein